MKRLVFCAVAGLFLATSCGPPLSVFPLFTEETLVSAPELIGDWAGDPDVSLKISQVDGKKTLRASWHEENECPAEFEIHAVRLGDRLFWDWTPSEHQSHETDNDVLEYHTLPLHSFARVDVEGDRLRVAVMDYDWLTKQIESGKVKLDHVMLDGKIPLLTASTEDLQAFFAENAGNPDAFPEEEEKLEFTRVK